MNTRIFDSQRIREHILAYQADPDLVYLDNAATSLSPDILAQADAEYLLRVHAPVYRATYPRAEAATQQYQQARATVAAWIDALPHEVVFTGGATHSIDIAIRALVAPLLKEGDEILMSPLEHHSLQLPFLRIAKACRAHIRFLPVMSNLLISYDAVEQYWSNKTKFFVGSLVSHVTGIADGALWELVQLMAKKHDTITIADGAQYLGHGMINRLHTKTDVFIASAHKAMGPTGIGLLKIAERLHQRLEPAILGGGMVTKVLSHDIDMLCDIREVQFQSMPLLLEAGSPATQQAYGWKQVITWMKDWDHVAQQHHEASLIDYAYRSLQEIAAIRIVAPYLPQGGVRTHSLAFYHETIHAHDIGYGLGLQGVCVRAGTLCAQPAMSYIQSPAVIRISVHAYTTQSDISHFVFALQKVLQALL